MSNKVITFEYEIEHKLDISVVGGKVMFDESKQEIYLTKMSVKPAVEITKVELLANYPEGTEKAISDAMSKIINVEAKATPVREAKPRGNIINAGDIKPIKEAAIPDMSVNVITDMLNIPTQVNVDGTNFKVVTQASDMSQFITFRQSKKIKIFINGKEFAPRQELEFIKRVFPQINMTVYIK